MVDKEEETSISEQKDIDKFSNAKRMKIAIRETKTHRRLNSPDVFSIAMIEDFINQERKIWGFSEEEIRYAVKVVYSKRVKRHEHPIQFLKFS
jgi:hypothetical protein